MIIISEIHIRGSNTIFYAGHKGLLFFMTIENIATHSNS
jgi:hypothetical protein